MTTTFTLPDLGEGLTESTILTWYVTEGEEVELNQVIAEVETAKAVVDLPSPHAGRIVALHAAEGETLPVGSPLVDFALADDDGAPTPFEQPAASAATPSASATTPSADSRMAHREARATEPASAAPQRQAVLVGYGPKLDAGTRPRRRARSFPTVPYERFGEDDHARETPRAMPPVRHLARTLGVDLRTVSGSGPGGRVLRSDVEACAPGTATVARSRSTDKVTSTPGQPTGTPEGSPSSYVPVTGLRRQTARAMTESAFTAPHATVFSTVDVTATLELLRRTGEGDRSPSFLSLVCRAAMLAAHRTPSANARFDAEHARIEQFGRIDLGIAVATDRGLVVATIRAADELDAPTLTERIAAQARKARAAELTPAEVTGSTLTVTNVGVFGVDGGVPILNPGQSAIVAVGAVRTRPWEHEGQVALRQVVTVTVSFDHRVLDGAEASAFLTDITDVLADPALLLAR